jgi:regulator of sirC expression with transglutaminase-like and TPR domain
MEATRRFALAVNRDEPDVDLAEACFLIAQHIYPELDVARELRRIDAIALRSPPGFDGIRKYLFDDLGFHGNTERYDDPRNSFLNDVLDTQRGIPITLSILMIEVGKRAGVPISGIGMPAHFVVRHEGTPRVYCDPFAAGEILDAAGCRDRFHEIVGDEVPFDPKWLNPMGRHAIMLRVLANLKDVYQQKNQPQNVEWVTRARLSVPGCPVLERRDLAQALAQQGRFNEAAAELELTAGTTLDPDARHDLMSEAVTMRARLN